MGLGILSKEPAVAGIVVILLIDLLLARRVPLARRLQAELAALPANLCGRGRWADCLLCRSPASEGTAGSCAAFRRWTIS